jgi:hypothetical protein
MLSLPFLSIAALDEMMVCSGDAMHKVFVLALRKKKKHQKVSAKIPKK